MRNVISRLYHGETNIDFLGKRKIWFTISAVLLSVSILALMFRPTESPCQSPLPSGLECGIEFNGGLSISAPVAEDGPLADVDQLGIIAEVRDRLSTVGEGDAQIQVAEAEGQQTILVQTRAVDQEAREQIRDVVAEATGASVEETSIDAISAAWGGEITSKAIRALIIFLLVIMAFISWRFEWKMGVAAIGALFHDVVITAGIYSLVGFEVTPSTVIAILTILGYSLYDTVVVFDKVEEDTTALAATGKMTYEDAANLAMNQVFMRSLNTSLATLLPVSALLFVGAGLLGASTLEDLALALFIGILVGTYSSIFFATPILTVLKEREPKYRNVRERVLRDAKKSAAASAEEPAADGTEEEPVAASVSSRPAKAAPSAGPGPRRAPVGSKKAKRRKRR